MTRQSPDFNDITDSKHWQKISFLNKGWSADKKYCIETDNGSKLTIRLADISQYENKKIEYERMSLICKLGIEMSQPIDFGVCDGGRNVYILLSWLEGDSLEERLPKLSTPKQYELGIAAGQILRKIHSVNAPETQPDWEARMTAKIEMKKSQYSNCGFTVPNDKTIGQFIHNSLKYLQNRNQTMQHGDFHPGNLVLTPLGRLGVIDFNRMDFGDPWEEFVRVTTFTKSISTPFARSQIDGYFGGQPPELFFRLLALYSAIDAHFGIIWAIPFGQPEIDNSLARSKSVFEDYHGFETFVPEWYE